MKLNISNDFYKKLRGGFLLIAIFFTGSCNYLDIVPDGVATIESAFKTRHTAEKYLFTCYSYLPKTGRLTENPALIGGDEVWLYYPESPTFGGVGRELARGLQNVVNPYLNFWDGANSGIPLYRAIRDCNTFLENIDRVEDPDLDGSEKRKWIAEVKFLKAWYHFWLVRSYGPIVIMDENLPVSVSEDDVKLYRQPVDTCFNYIVHLLDEALENLPEIITDDLSELGRIDKAIGLSVKAKVLVTAASPLFNGNPDYSDFVDNKGINLFSTDYDPVKWDSAAAACKRAIEFCESKNYSLYQFESSVPGMTMSPKTSLKMSIRNSVTDKWNYEIIWANAGNTATTLQNEATPTGLDPNSQGNNSIRGNLAVPLKFVEKYYTENGLPIDEDPNYDYNRRYELKDADNSDKYDLQVGYTTALLNFKREPRYYAHLAFDGATWYGQGRLDDNDPWNVQAKNGQASTKVTNNRWNITGYWIKKYVHYESIIGTGNTYTTKSYPFPMFRLPDLYLLYAEALNEAGGDNDEIYYYLDLIRERAGIPNVEQAWQNSKHPDQLSTKGGRREVIHRERTIELAFEGERFWDLRRWKTALQEYNQPIFGWHIDQSQEEAYYQPRLLFNQTFKLKDYFWPVRESNILVDKNLVQNPGW